MIPRPTIRILMVVIALGLLQPLNTSAQKPSRVEIGQWRDVLRVVKTELKDSYYDPNFNGVDIDVRFKTAEEKMANAASLEQLNGIIAQVLLDLNDSHTYFLPPHGSTRMEYGWRMQPVGDDCYVGAVRPGSDAEAKGLRAGDKVLSIDGKPMDRSKIWLANYFYYKLQRQTAMTLLVEKPDKRQQELAIKAKMRNDVNLDFRDFYFVQREPHREEERRSRDRFQALSDDVLVWKMREVEFAPDELENRIGRLKKRKALILDLRGNAGGYTRSLEDLAGYFFDSKLKIADRRGRKQLKPVMVRTKKENVFKGRLIVLIDGSSSSEAEVFARLVQLEKRGIVIGDRSAGSVMQARYLPLQIGALNLIDFGIVATEADLITADGKSLEHVGVTPDVLLLPTAEDMSTQSDPVLAHAASLLGVKLDPKKAGQMFPTEWK
jgi:carboxyl-terminal processing protease